jgi:hypothetical protein
MRMSNKNIRYDSSSLFYQSMCYRFQDEIPDTHTIKLLAERCIEAVIIFNQVQEEILGPKEEDCHLDD